MFTDMTKGNDVIALDLSNDELAEYFGLDIDTIIETRYKMIEFVLTPGHHSVTDQMMIIDEEYPGNKENIYAKFCYGIIIGQIIAKQYMIDFTKGGIQ